MGVWILRRPYPQTAAREAPILRVTSGHLVAAQAGVLGRSGCRVAQAPPTAVRISGGRDYLWEALGESKNCEARLRISEIFFGLPEGCGAVPH